MKLTGVELRRIRLPLVGEFRTSFGSQKARDALLVRAVSPDGDGWGECVALAAPVYSPEYVDGAEHLIRHHLLPPLFADHELTAEKVAPLLSHVKGNQMAKGALEMALLDLELRLRDESLATHLGAVREWVDCGVSVGIMNDIGELIDAVAGYLDQGYKRIKLKIEPGWDVKAVQAVRERFGDILLQVDANTAYTLQDAAHLAELDEFNLLLIEQPFEEEDVRSHAELAKQIRTPVCLDESINSARAATDAIAIGACSIVNIKAGRVGGYLEAKRVHDVCEAKGVPVWCGGMLETGLGRAANVALAALPNFTLPGDTSASDRYFAQDITEPFVLDDGRLRVPTGPGLGVTVSQDALDQVTTSTKYIPAVKPAGRK